MAEIWVWVRVPLRAIERVIQLLKDAVQRGHAEASRTGDPDKRAQLRAAADQDDEDAETFKREVRDETEEPPPTRRNRE